MEITNLKEYVEERRRDYYAEYEAKNEKPHFEFEEEGVVWAIQEYYSHKGEFTPEDCHYMRLILEFDPEDFEDHYEVWTLNDDDEVSSSVTYFDLSDAELVYEDYASHPRYGKVRLVRTTCLGEFIETIKSTVD